MENCAEVCFDFFDLIQYYDDEMSQGSYFSTFDPIDLPYSTELNGYDLVWVFSNGIYVRTKDPSKYKYLEDINQVHYVAYESYWEHQTEDPEDF